MHRTSRQLAREFYRGELGWDEYRALRRALIDRFIATKASSPEGLHGASTIQPGDTVPDLRVNQRDGFEASKSSSRYKWLLIFTVFVTTAGVLGYIYMVSNEGTEVIQKLINKLNTVIGELRKFDFS